MCGITGYYNIAGVNRAEFREELSRAVTTLNHRGPDDSGLWFNTQRSVGLGHARLAILDLSQHGHQPMVSADGRYVLVFNGEVYNFREIREELEGKGFQFKGSGDSEVVLSAFQAWGNACVYRFIGMFAFAVWDEKEQRMSLFRDRVGVKPLYYGWDGKVLWFGSELKALRAFWHWQPDINHQALGEFFQYGYIAAPRSIYRQVSKVMPGHWLEISRQKPEPALHRYWSVLDAVAQGLLQASEDELTDQLEDLLISAFRYRMVADVPVGVFLSGGIDSSIVAAILQKHAGQQIHTFTIGFEDKTCDESGWAKKVASHLGTRHTEYILGLDKAREIIPKLPQLYDEPFGDSSGIPTSMVSSLAREEVKVVLSADGGDELFGGYTSYALNPARLKAIAGKPYWLRWLAGKGLSAMPVTAMAKVMGAASLAGSSESPSKLLRKMIKLMSVLPDVTPSAVFHASQAHFMPLEIDRLIGGYEDPRRPVGVYSGSFEEQMTQWDFQHYLPDDIMTKVDRATMGVSLEGREPLLDQRLIEFAFRLPLHLRIGKLGQKHLLRKVLYRYVPRILIDRPKQGFSIPINRWMREDNARMVQGLLSSESSLNGVLNQEMVHREVNLLRKTGVNETRVWLMFVLGKWMDIYEKVNIRDSVNV